MVTFNSYDLTLEPALERLRQCARGERAVLCEYPSWLREVSYKPNFRFDIICEQTVWSFGQSHDHRFICVAEFDDAYHQDRKTHVAFNYGVRGELPKEAFIDYIRHCFWMIEQHELDEFLRVDGVPVRDPHGGVTDGLPQGR
ncbi:MAG TPA: hypothetical protein VFI41_05125 [Gemmatimonadales bacterium]|nr:hypothetical protein [Gemmatimonadales bacterium]